MTGVRAATGTAGAAAPATVEPAAVELTPAPEPVPAARPLRAVDAWHVTRDGDSLAITARVRIDGDDPNLRGHFPGRPVFPGVFVIEAMCQAMALATADDPAPVGLSVLRSVRFVAPLLDGDELTLAITARRDGPGWTVAAVGTRADATTAARVQADFAPEAAARA